MNFDSHFTLHQELPQNSLFKIITCLKENIRENFWNLELHISDVMSLAYP